MPSRHLLIVESDARVEHLVRAIVDTDGWVCRSRRSAELVEDIDLRWADVAVVDNSLPGDSGLEYLSSLGPNPATPIVVMTSDHNLEDDALDLGAAGFVPMPFDVSDLLDMLSEVAASSSTRNGRRRS